MAYFINGYPYSDTHNLNLDWVIDTLKRIETEMGQLHDGLEIHVTGNDGTEIYTFTVKANGIYITRPDGGTPFFYNFDTQTLYASKFDGQQFLTASGRTTGQFRAGSLVLDNALPIAQGGTGATNAEAARNALGAEAAFDILPINKGGTGATSAEAARTALGAEAAFEILPVSKGGTGATGVQGHSITMGANCVLTNSAIMRWGRLLVLNCVITVNTALTSGTNVFTIGNIEDSTGGPATFIKAHRLDGAFKSLYKPANSYAVNVNNDLPNGIWYINASMLF